MSFATTYPAENSIFNVRNLAAILASWEHAPDQLAENLLRAVRSSSPGDLSPFQMACYFTYLIRSAIDEIPPYLQQDPTEQRSFAKKHDVLANLICQPGALQAGFIALGLDVPPVQAYPQGIQIGRKREVDEEEEEDDDHVQAKRPRLTGLDALASAASAALVQDPTAATSQPSVSSSSSLLLPSDASEASRPPSNIEQASHDDHATLATSQILVETQHSSSSRLHAIPSSTDVQPSAPLAASSNPHSLPPLADPTKSYDPNQCSPQLYAYEEVKEVSADSEHIEEAVVGRDAAKEYRQVIKELTSDEQVAADKRADLKDVDLYSDFVEIGRGGQGRLFKATHWSKGHVVAVKEARKSEDYAELGREAKFLKALGRHPNVVDFIGVYETYYGPHLVLGLAVRDLNTQMRLRSFSREEVAYIIAEMLTGLAFLHKQGVIHCDLKLGNALVSPTGNIKLTDFGMSTCAQADGTIDSRGGTPIFRAPEVLTAKRWNGYLSDMWSIGMTAYTACEFRCLLSLQTPAIRLCDESAVEQFLGSLDVNNVFADDFDDLELKAFFLKTIQVNPRKRSSATELLEHDDFLQAACTRDTWMEAVCLH